MKVLDQLESRRKWDENERLILDQVDRVVATVILPNASRIDKFGEFPWANIKAINDVGLNTIFIPEAFGGAPTSFRLYLSVVTGLLEDCASTGIFYATNFHA